MKLESSSRRWKIFDQYYIENFPTSIGPFQLKWQLSNCPFQLHVSPLRIKERIRYIICFDNLIYQKICYIFILLKKYRMIFIQKLKINVLRFKPMIIKLIIVLLIGLLFGLFLYSAPGLIMQKILGV